MTTSITAYPLAWPLRWPRTPTHKRKRAQFGKQGTSPYGYATKKPLSVTDGTDRLLDELSRLGAKKAVISTNIPVRRDGLPYSNRKAPTDVGVAVYFDLDAEPHCLPCDRWDRVADNLAAVAAHIAALRGIERWGVGDIRAAFAGYQALPPARTNGQPWYEVLGVSPGADEATLRLAYRRRAMETHPDRNPDDPDAEGRFKTVQEAFNRGMEVLSIT